MRSPKRPHHAVAVIEPLESRIAPAALIAFNYGDVLKNSKGLTVMQFVNAADTHLTGSNLAIAESVGQSSNVYFIKVPAGDDLQVFTSTSGVADLVNVTHGTVLAFFVDTDGPGGPVQPGVTPDTVLASNLSGLALGTKVSAVIGNDVLGDVVTNYNDSTGQLGGTVASHGHVATTEAGGNATMLLPNVISSLVIQGAIDGNFIAGGNVSKLQISTTANDLLTGTAANGRTFNFAPGENGTPVTPPDLTLAVAQPLAGVAGPSLAGVSVQNAKLITLGDGGPGAAGGGINGLTLTNQNTAITVTGGTGGDGAAGHTGGGAGGSISNVVVNGLQSGSAPTSNNLVLDFTGGLGGDGLGSAKGGAGGSVGNVYVGYTHLTAAFTQAGTYLPDNLVIQGGAGGTGGSAGAGGSLNNINVLLATPADSTLPVVMPEFQLLGGAGGSTTVGGHGGAGGSVNGVNLSNKDILIFNTNDVPDDSAATSPTNSFVVVKAGDGGTAAVKGPGGAGGSLNNLTLEGYNFTLISGDGGNGVSAGGAGGKVNAVTLVSSPGELPGDSFHAESLYVSTGIGGDGSAGAGGAGGAITGLTAQSAAFGASSYDGTSLNNIGLDVLTGHGGAGAKGKSGAGGAIANIIVGQVTFETVTLPGGNISTIQVLSGTGGSGTGATASGGAGGAISNVIFVGERVASSAVIAGHGGSGGSAGKGGAGGAISGASVRNSQDVIVSNTTATTGDLKNSSADFTTDGTAVNDEIENTTTGATTTVTSIVSATEVDLASDIFATGDAYTDVATGSSGSAEDSQDTLVDATANFVAEGVSTGMTVEDLTNLAYNQANPTLTAEPVYAQITNVTATTLSLTSSTTSSPTSGDISHVGDQYTIVELEAGEAGVTFTAGAGGDGFGHAAGGAGGNINNSNAALPGSVFFVAGNGGGGGTTGAAGVGGSLLTDGAISGHGSASYLTGSAGQSGGKGAAGGSVVSANIQVPLNITIKASNGYLNGAGGSITSSGYSTGPGFTLGVLNTTLSLEAPTGAISVEAGNGGTNGAGPAGAGGSINGLKGFISTGAGEATQIAGGMGGSGSTKAGAGGSVSALKFFGGGAVDGLFTINAGDAGNSTAGHTGAAGGSISNVSAGVFTSGSDSDPSFSINTSENFLMVSAGNGGSGVTKGGVGGSVSGLSVNGAIGTRFGKAFGFDINGAGGISVGSGGAGATAGLPGNVSSVTADAIASIVAGHLGTGAALQATNLAGTVSGVILNGTTPPSTFQEVTFTYKGQTSVTEVPTNATPTELLNSVNSIPSVIAAGGVNIVETNGNYSITFNNAGAGFGAGNQITAQQPSPQYTTVVVPGNATTMEKENIQTLGTESFTLTLDGTTTSQINYNAASAAEAAQIQSDLDAIVPGITVTTNNTTPAPSYDVTFPSVGSQSPIVENMLYALTGPTGSATTVNSEMLTAPVRTDLNPIELATANYVGSVAVPLRLNATQFTFTGTTPFAFGDVPVDGLIAALNLTANKNFVPEAYVTLTSGVAQLVDNTIS